MKARVLVGGHDGRAAVADGAEVEADSEWLRRLLANGLAEPLDAEAAAVVAAAAAEGVGYRHYSAALRRQADRIGGRHADRAMVAAAVTATVAATDGEG